MSIASARLAVRGRIGQPKIGIFELGTHRVVHIPQCQIHHPLINEVCEAVRRGLVAHRLPLYSDSAHAGRVRYLQVAVERESASAQLVVVTNDPTYHGLADFFDEVSARLGPRLHSLFWNGQPERSNAVLGSVYSVLNKLFDVLPELLIGVAVDVVVNQKASFLARLGVIDPMQQLYLLVALTIVIWVLESGFEYLYALKWRGLAQDLQHTLRNAAYAHLQALPPDTIAASAAAA